MQLIKMTGVVLALVLIVSCSAATSENAGFKIVIHGGAGTLRRENMTPATEAMYLAKLEEALDAGYAILDSGGSSVDAVQAAIVVMEDSPLFNAGKGAVFTHDQTNEMDASIMDGKTLNAGAVSGVSRVKNPIRLAASVMEHSPHVMLTGAGAERFARTLDTEMVDPAYFRTDRRLKQLHDALEAEQTSRSNAPLLPEVYKYGTVGAVALDKLGNLAAATSTGGMTNKRYGRIGDSPIIGAGTYADNASCAVSATGHGEYFIRAAVAHDICARVQYQGDTLQVAADAVIQEKLLNMGGSGGIIALTTAGNVVFSFNTLGMYRGEKGSDGSTSVAIYK